MYKSVCSQFIIAFVRMTINIHRRDKLVKYIVLYRDLFYLCTSKSYLTA